MLETLLKRDRYFVFIGLSAIALLAWSYLVYLTQDMTGMDVRMDMEMGAMASMPQTEPWSLVEFVLMFIMWAMMMVAMMIPAAAPIILIFAAIQRKRTSAVTPFTRTGAFVLGYFLVWTGFSLIATAGQSLLHAAALLSPMMVTTSTIVSSLILLAAGLYQWSPLKYACLHHCRSPLGFLLSEWREGAWGALVMGSKHGMYCLGCCWLLMALLFVAGVMNLLWIAFLAVVVLLEKVAPGAHYLSRGVGVIFIAWGVWLGVGMLV
jgi:predicted metal-binding membrane protein